MPHGHSHLSVRVSVCGVCWLVGWLVGWLMSQQHASVSQGQICSDKCTYYHTEIKVADQTFYPTGPTSPSVDPITSGAWQCSHWSANFGFCFFLTGITRPRKILV